MTSKAEARVGTSNIMLPGNKSTFPDAYKNASRLQYYASLFNSVEINSSFYKIPQPKTFAKWADDVPDSFSFTVKLWQGITHAKNLACDLDDINKFMDAANCLGKKRGSLLIQFPASIKFDSLPAMQKILDRLDQLNAYSDWQVAIEMRDTSWYCDIFYTLLAGYKADLVIHDMPKSATPKEYKAKSFAYYRFHGPTGKYTGGYADDILTAYAKDMKKCQRDGKTVYVYFNNSLGDALKNAQFIQAALERNI